MLEQELGMSNECFWPGESPGMVWMSVDSLMDSGASLESLTPTNILFSWEKNIKFGWGSLNLQVAATFRGTQMQIHTQQLQALSPSQMVFKIHYLGWSLWAIKACVNIRSFNYSGDTVH